jgi:hypothetical protein
MKLHQVSDYKWFMNSFQIQRTIEFTAASWKTRRISEASAFGSLAR